MKNKMGNLYRENGFVEKTIWRAIKCIFSFHWWMCLSATDEKGNYVECPQVWECRVCAEEKLTFRWNKR